MAKKAGLVLGALAVYVIAQAEARTPGTVRASTESATDIGSSAVESAGVLGQDVLASARPLVDEARSAVGTPSQEGVLPAGQLGGVQGE